MEGECPAYFTPGTDVLLRRRAATSSKGKRDYEARQEAAEAEAGYNGEKVAHDGGRPTWPSPRPRATSTADLLQKHRHERRLPGDWTGARSAPAGPRRTRSVQGRLEHLPHLARGGRLHQPGALTRRWTRPAPRPGSAWPDSDGGAGPHRRLVCQHRRRGSGERRRIEQHQRRRVQGRGVRARSASSWATPSWRKKLSAASSSRPSRSSGASRKSLMFGYTRPPCRSPPYRSWRWWRCSSSACSISPPGDPAAIIAGDQASPADVERIRAGLGLDRPFLIRFGEWVVERAERRDFGHVDLHQPAGHAHDRAADRADAVA